MLKYNPILEESDKLSTIVGVAVAATTIAMNLKKSVTIAATIASAIVVKTAVTAVSYKLFNDSPEYGNYKAKVCDTKKI